MNENQAAHGERELGHIFARMRWEHKVVFGYWQDEAVLAELGQWMRVAVGVNESRNIRVCRFADTMRNVAVTDGDKIEAQQVFGWTVDAWPVNELVPYVDAVTPDEVKALTDEYYDTYELVLDGRDPEEFRRHVEVQAAQEIGIERFLVEHGYNAFSDHFGDLGGLKQLPSLSIQRLMQKGYGFGPEGDWKTPAMVRLMKVMTAGDPSAKGSAPHGGLHLQPGARQGGHPRVPHGRGRPSVAEGPVAIRATPLSMGDREDPARLIFTAKTGPAIATSLVDLGNRFRLIIQDVDCKKVEKPMPMLPTGTVFWTPRPNLKVGTEAWIYAGGAHHTAFSYDPHGRPDGRLGGRHGHRERGHRRRHHHPRLQARPQARRGITADDEERRSLRHHVNRGGRDLARGAAASLNKENTWHLTKEQIVEELESGATALGIEYGSTRIKAVLVDSQNAPIKPSAPSTGENSLIDGYWTLSDEEILRALPPPTRPLGGRCREVRRRSSAWALWHLRDDARLPAL